jgi:Ca-activated chloride channel homolog
MLVRFLHPEFLWLLLLVPLAALLAGRAGKRAALQFPATGIARNVSRLVRGRPGRISDWLKIMALVAGILALARPQAGTESRSQRFEGIDIMLTVDLSSSMWAHDFEIDGVRHDRLTAVKSVMEEFIAARRHDRIGLIAFAGYPYLVSPLTINHPWLLRRLQDLEIAMIEDGTAIGSAIGSAVNRLQDRSGGTGIIVLLTDGANNRGQINPMQAAEAAAALGIRVYTVGVGQDDPAPFPRLDQRTGKPLRDRTGRMAFVQVPPDLDLEMLQAVADRTGGRFFHARNIRELENVYSEIDAIERTEVNLQAAALYRDRFALPLGVCLFFYLLDWVLRHTRYKRLP